MVIGPHHGHKAAAQAIVPRMLSGAASEAAQASQDLPKDLPSPAVFNSHDCGLHL